MQSALRTLCLASAGITTHLVLLALLGPAVDARPWQASAPGEAPRPARLRACDDVPAGLTAADLSGIRQAFEAHRHAATLLEGGGYQARNPGQEWLTVFDGRGFLTRPDAGEWTWGLELLRYGFAERERAVGEPKAVGAAGPRVAYAWDETLEEWYVNRSSGLEHGFTLHQRPPRSEDGPLTFTLAVRGDLLPEVVAGGRDVRFLSAGGAPVLDYAGLIVTDADGAVLAARFERVAGGLRLSIDEDGARYPLTVDPTAQNIVQQAYLKASNLAGSDLFGGSISISGDTVVVGATGEDYDATGTISNPGFNAGAAYVFVRDSLGNWSQQAYLKASNADASDSFGASVTVSGDTVVVGAPGEDSSAKGASASDLVAQGDNSASNAGAAYVFVRTAGAWHQEAYLKASNTTWLDRFGWSVAVSGDTVVVGAPGEDSLGWTNGGAAYVFGRIGTTWQEEAHLKAGSAPSLDWGAPPEFGSAVAVSGNTVVVGTSEEDGNASSGFGPADAGAAYVYVRDSLGKWAEEAHLRATNLEEYDRFGSSVAISGDTAVIGAPGEDSNAQGVNLDQSDNSASSSGAAYIFVRNGTSWQPEAYLKASNTDSGDQFGHAVAVCANTVAVGALGEESSAVGVDGDESNNDAQFSGAAYVFGRCGATWHQRAYLKASNTEVNSQFGKSVAVSCSTAVVGAHLEDGNALGVDTPLTGEAGAGYVFDLGPEPQPSAFPGWVPTFAQQLVGSVSALVVFNDSLYVGGSFATADGLAANNIARWDGTGWSVLESGGIPGVNGPVRALAVYGGELYAGGQFTSAGNVAATAIAKWNGTAWSALSGTLQGSPFDFDPSVRALTVYGGELQVGGRFLSAGTLSVPHIASWNGTGWSALGSGISLGIDDSVSALQVSGGALYAGGRFSAAGSVTANNIAKWDGTSWSSLGSGAANGTDADVLALATYGGALHAGGLFPLAGNVLAHGVAKWDGAAWAALGGGIGPFYGSVNALTVFDDGSGPALHAGGNFTTAGTVAANSIAKWNGNDWSALASGIGATGPWGGVAALTVYYDDDGPGLYAGGAFSTAGGAAEQNLAKWVGCPLSLTADVDSISLSAGGTQHLRLDAGTTNAGRLYLLLGSITGSTPGTPLGPGLVLPLNIVGDPYFDLTLTNPSLTLTGSYGSLDAKGEAAATCSLPAGTASAYPGLVGKTVHHAYLLLLPAVDFASNAVACLLAP